MTDLNEQGSGGSNYQEFEMDGLKTDSERGEGGSNDPKLEMKGLITDSEKKLEGALNEERPEGYEKEKEQEESGGESGENLETENYSEDLGILIDKYIQDTEVDGKVGRAFVKFCEAECGRFEGYLVDIKSFMTCLSVFYEKILPEYRKYVKIDEKYL